MTLKVIHRLQAFSNAIRRTFVQHFTRFQLTVCSHGSSALAELLVFRFLCFYLCHVLCFCLCLSCTSGAILIINNNKLVVYCARCICCRVVVRCAACMFQRQRRRCRGLEGIDDEIIGHRRQPYNGQTYDNSYVRPRSSFVRVGE